MRSTSLLRLCLVGLLATSCAHAPQDLPPEPPLVAATRVEGTSGTTTRTFSFVGSWVTA